MEPADFYGVRGAGFTSLRRELGWLPGDPHPQEESLNRAIGAGLLHLDDPDRLRATAAALAAPLPPDPVALGERERRQWTMLFAQLLGTGQHWRPLAEAMELLWAVDPWREELRQLLELLAGRCERRLHPLPWALPVPLRVHGRYSRAEVLAAFDAVDERGAPRSHREGVLWDQSSATDPLCVTLKKREALFSPSTRYRDLALGPSLFHWESQSTTTAASATGQRYIHHEARGSRVLRLVREQRREGGRGGGVTEPFVCLGFARYESHEGERPMAGGFSGVAAGAGDSGGVDAGDGVGGLRGISGSPEHPVKLVISELRRQAMADVKALEQAVEALDPSALAEFRRWFAEFDAATWDRQLEADATAGKLDALLEEAEDDYRTLPHRQL